MASLEMMNLLAADLPSNQISPLRRSYTLNPKRLTRTPAKEMARKPPLPKLSSMSPGPSSPLMSPTITSRSPFTRHNSDVSDHTVASPVKTRPSDLPTKLVTAFEGMCLSPGQSRRADGLQGDRSPPKPVRKSLLKLGEPRYQSSATMEHDSTDTGSYSSNSPRAVSEDRDTRLYHGHHMASTRAGSEDPGTYHTNVSLDSGVLLSPSPPTDSGIALLSPGIKHRNYNNNVVTRRGPDHDSVSVLSYSELSEASDHSGSRYDNVHHLSTHDHDAELSDEGDETVLDNGDDTRVSGHYDNVMDTGLHSLRQMLTTGQTTNV